MNKISHLINLLYSKSKVKDMKVKGIKISSLYIISLLYSKSKVKDIKVIVKARL